MAGAIALYSIPPAPASGREVSMKRSALIILVTFLLLAFNSWFGKAHADVASEAKALRLLNSYGFAYLETDGKPLHPGLRADLESLALKGKAYLLTDDYCEAYYGPNPPPKNYAIPDCSGKAASSASAASQSWQLQLLSWLVIGAIGLAMLTAIRRQFQRRRKPEVVHVQHHTRQPPQAQARFSQFHKPQGKRGVG